MNVKKICLTLLAGGLALFAFVVDEKREKMDREEVKEELKQELLLELRSEQK